MRSGRGRVFFKVDICFDVDTWEKNGNIEFLYTRVANYKLVLNIFKADPLTIYPKILRY